MPSPRAGDAAVHDEPVTDPEQTAVGADTEPAAPAELAQPDVGDPDPVAAAAVDVARAAAEEIAESGTVGEHLGVQAEAPGVVTHAFACTARGYRGWYWAISVVNVPGDEVPTVSDTVLLPGGDAVLSPTWLPWSDRLAPGDLRAADVLPYRADDPYLEPGYTQVDDEDADAVALWELGLGRARVLGPLGRAAAAERWYLGDRGPTAEEAVQTAAPCSTCAYFLPLAGALRQVFGVCANEWSPSDARVVSVDHGCGAHSETDVEPVESVALPEPILDETSADSFVIVRRAQEPADDVPVEVVDADAAVVVVEEPVVDGPVLDESVLDGPVLDGPVLDGPVLDGPVLDEPVVDGPVLDEPVVDGPVLDEPVVDGPVLDEPVTEAVTPEP